LIAPDAVKRRLPSLAFKSTIIASIIVKPESEKKRRDKQTVKNHGAGEIKHASELGRGAAGGARISMQVSSIALPRTAARIRTQSRGILKNKKRADSDVGALK